MPKLLKEQGLFFFFPPEVTGLNKLLWFHSQDDFSPLQPYASMSPNLGLQARLHQDKHLPQYKEQRRNKQARRRR